MSIIDESNSIPEDETDVEDYDEYIEEEESREVVVDYDESAEEILPEK